MKPPRVSWPILRLIIIALIPVGLALAIWQPWQQMRQVIYAPVPRSHYVIELWEKPYWRLGLGCEYQTWLVVRSAHEKERWYLIDAQYITFRDVIVLISSDHNRIRVETNGGGGASHMIAEYNLVHKEFRAASEPTVRNTQGWAVLSEARIH